MSAMRQVVFSNVLFVLFALSVSVPAEYQVTEIGDPGSFASAPVINDSGVMAWVYSDGVTTDIVLFDGSVITRLETAEWEDSSPFINAAGQVAWVGISGDKWDIFVYDGASITRMYAPCTRVRLPQISTSGTIAWEGDYNTSGIYYFDGTDISRLSGYSGFAYNLSLNSQGDIVWSEAPNFSQTWNLYMFDGTDIVQLTYQNQYNVLPQMNDQGVVVWQGFDGADWDVYLREEEGDILRLSNPGCVDMYPRVNNLGHAVWISTLAGCTDICFWDGQQILRIPTEGTDSNPRISDSGILVWEMYDGQDVEIMMFDGTQILQLTDNDVNDIRPWVNSMGLVTWQRLGAAGSQIVLAEPRDDIPPEINAVVASPSILWPPDHQMVPVELTIDATDNQNDTLASRIVSVASNEPQDGTGDGDTGPDWSITGDTTLDLRAERSGTGDGRVYTVTVECSDEAGNRTTAEVQVRVPKSRKK